MVFVLASQNQGKLRELSAILGNYGATVCLEADLGLHIDVEETGVTFEENSRLKARTVFDACKGCAVIADDSGLMVDALDGAPGIYSARYGGSACKNDAERNAYLLEQMKDVPDGARGGCFVSVITCLLPDGTELVCRGECRGEILREPRGKDGFGFDPIFYVPEAGGTFAELQPEVKNQISHRSRALAALERAFREYQKGATKDDR